MKELIKRLLRESLSDNIIVYSCVNGDYNINLNKINYFAKNIEYSQKFSDNCYKFKLNLKDAKVLNLEKWNKLYYDKTGDKGNIYNRTQGLFVVGSKSINNGYVEPLKKFRDALGDEMATQFINEFNECDVIFGEDAGYHEEVFAVKNKNLITLLGKI